MFGVVLFMVVFSVDTAMAGEATDVTVAGFARETPPGAPMGVAYLRIHNGGARERRLLRVELPRHPDASAQLHSTVREGGVSRMRPLSEIELPMGQSLEMQPGATHLMLRGVRLAAGENLPLRLIFADGGALEVEIPVRAEAPSEHRGHGHHHG
ncbi:copper chaperone PCu(A)C [Microbulbifer aggregans]|uniref:copper chaperone PCu(A)C n=1 Tax=Microbulbifer aggregans TaxID=1769779 RepID=UPI001CFE5E3B|nr:copper chaperone PCu(A)C [Microbulbifer aggregans]